MNNLKYNVKKLGIVVQEFVVSEGGTKIVEKVYNCPDNVLQDKNVRAKALCVKRQTPILLPYDVYAPFVQISTEIEHQLVL